MSREKIPGQLVNFQDLCFKGLYKNDELYEQNDVVQYESRFWLYVFDTPNSNAAPAFPSNFWKDLGGECTVKTGLLSSRPLASVDNKGRFYFANDSFEQRLYYSTGVDWQLVGVPVVANTTRPGLVRVNSNDVDPIVYRKQEIDASVTTSNLTVVTSSTVPIQSLSDSSAQIANTKFVQDLHIAKDSRFKDIVFGRLSLSSSSNDGDVSSSGIIYFNPCQTHNAEQISNKGLIGLYVDNAWRLIEFQQAQLSLTGLAASTAYDVFVEYNSSTQQIVLSTRAWTNLSTRVALFSHDGVWVKGSGELNRRYVGSFLIGTSSGLTEDDLNSRYVWNFYNRINKRVYSANTAASLTYNYSVAAWAESTYTPSVSIFSGWSNNSIDLRYVPPAVGCSVSALSVASYQYIGVVVNTGSAAQIIGQPCLHTAAIVMQPSMVDLSSYTFGLGRLTFKTYMYSFNPGGGGVVTFHPMNSYLGGLYRC